MTEFKGFDPEIDSVKDYAIPPSITSIEWLNRSALSDTMTFLVANDKKIKLFKLRKDFVVDFRGHAHENQQDSDGYPETGSTFVERFIQSNGQIIFPTLQAYNNLTSQSQA